MSSLRVTSDEVAACVPTTISLTIVEYSTHLRAKKGRKFVTKYLLSDQEEEERKKIVTKK
jgi:hypothetical protein